MRASCSRLALRDLLGAPICARPASVFDPLSARVAQLLGFQVAMLPGSLASHALLARPDNMIITSGELADASRRICEAAEIPLIVDADNGYGGMASVRRTVQQLEGAGIAALTIEDTLLPAPFGTSGKGHLTSLEEGRARVRAALQGRDDPSLIVVGRTSAAVISDLDDALARAVAYADEGADAVFLVGLTEIEQVRLVARAVRVPLMLGGAGPALHDLDALAALGVRILLGKHITLRRAVEAVYRAMREQMPDADAKGPAEPPQDLLERLLDDPPARSVGVAATPGAVPRRPGRGGEAPIRSAAGTPSPVPTSAH